MSPSAFNRGAAIHNLTESLERGESFDLIVIGGGITGAGVTLDAASRGLRTLLLEQNDFASGTSSRSSKLVHGGLRYLQQGDIGLVYEALAERQRLRKNAPHLVKLLPFLLPIFTKDGLFNRKIAWALGKAMWMYDLTGGARIGKLHQKLSTDETLAYMPTLPRQRLAGSYLYYDASTDDARLTLAVIQTAVEAYEATAINFAPVTQFTTTIDSRRPAQHTSSSSNATGKVKSGKAESGAKINGVITEIDGERFEIPAKFVVNAAGVWADYVRGLNDHEVGHSIRPAKGVHISVPWTKVRNEVAAVIPVRSDRRSIFVVPWGDQTYIGTTDTDYEGPLDDPRCEEKDVEYLLEAMNASLTEPLSRADVLGTWAGLRPLVRGSENDEGRTADLSRKHHLSVDSDQLISINGGKLTTYRKMAEDTVDLVVSLTDDATKSRLHNSARTKSLPLVGARGYFQFLRQIPAFIAAFEAHGVGTSTAEREDLLVHLANRYGGRARVLVAMIEADPSLATRLHPSHPFVEAEVLYALRYEMAITIEAILTRRVPLRLHDSHAAWHSTDRVSDLIAAELGWSEAEQRQEVASFKELLNSERESAGFTS